MVAVEKGKLRTKNLGATKLAAKPAVAINQGHLTVTVNGKTTNIDPQGRSSYLWPALSPDGKKIVYYAAYLGCFVCNLDGSNPVSLGNLRAAKWLDDNTVVGMRDADNGDYVTESVVLAKSLDGKETKLTPETMIAMYPTATADGKKVAFSTVQGEVYVINLK